MRKKLYMLFLPVILFTLLLVPAGEARLPRGYTEFEARYREEGTTAEGASKLFFDAIFAYMNEATRSEGLKMLTLAMDEKSGWEKRQSMKIFVDRMENKDTAYIFRSYAKGAVPENGYAMNVNDYELLIERTHTGHPKGLQVYLRSGGADYPRVIYLNEKNGFWFVTDSSSVKVEVRPAGR